MGLDVSVHTYFAIETSRSVFFVRTGETKRVCPKAINAHAVTAHARFCEQCGTETTLLAIELPTPAFKAFCDKSEVTPEHAFEQLHSEGWEWSNDNGTTHTIGLHRVQSLDNGRMPDVVWGLGIKLERSTSHQHYDKASPIGYSIDDLTKLTPAVIEFAVELQISGVPKLYAQAYLSA